MCSSDLFAGLAALLVGAFGADATIGPFDTVPGIDAVGATLFRDFVLPFEAISFLLLAALVGAVVLSRKDDRP